MVEDFKMLVKLLVSGVVVLALFRECECCLSNEYTNRRNVLIHRYASHFVECLCKGEMAKLQYLQWAGPNKEVIPEEGPGTDKNVYAERVEDGLTLLIKNFTADLAGEYHCSAMYDDIYHIRTYQLKLYPHLQFVNTDTQQYLIKGQTSKIICEESSDDKIMTLWHLLSKNYAQISDNERYKIETNGLVIKNVQDDDDGVYQCSSVATETGDTNAINITVDVISVPVITDLKVTPSKTVVAGDFLKMECKGLGEPLPNYVWNKIINGKPMVLPLFDDNSTSWYQENDTLTFEAIKPEDRGTYRCTASNRGGIVTKEVTIEVLEPPEVIQFDNVTAVEGTRAEVVCRVRGRPIPKVFVLFEETGVESDTRISHSTFEISETELSFSLIFSPVGRSHHGFYMCQAVNDVDKVNETMLLDVLFKPVFEKPVESVWGWKGQIIELNCFYESNPEGNITWRYHGEQSTFKSLPHRFPHEPVARVMLGEIPMYGMYTCTVMNEIGSSTKIIHLNEAHPPGPLMNVVPKSKTATSVVFDIAGPSDVGGPPILAYTAEYDEADKYNTTHIHYNRTWDVYRQFRVDGLRPNTTYYFRFAAINQVAAGSWSAVLELATEEKSAPEEPMWEDNIADVYDNVNNVILSWKRPESNGQPIDYYEIKYCEDDGDDDVPSRCYSDKTDDNKIMLQNLKANTSYHIMLYAHNAVGNSQAAEKYIKTSDNASNQSLSASNIIGISVCVVVICLVLVDLMLCCWKDQGVIASVCCRKRKQKQNAKEKAKTIRDKKGLLSDGEGAADGAVRPENNGHKEFVYEKNTGAVTGKHSVV